MTRWRVQEIIILTVFLWAVATVTTAAMGGELLLQVLKMPEEKVLLSLPVHSGDHFYLDYTHSSDHTPIHDTFVIEEGGTIILLQEEFDWYGAGLEFHPGAKASISLEGKRTRVTMHRPFPNFLLRVGRVAGHRITCNDRVVPLQSIANGGDLVLIRTVDSKGVLHD
ncbi:MAG: DUF1850 domain-containing protein [Deltaproteobacteria bacterium]|nr:DUF1850 domain-containing protein [Deltaproteobacteria bacterium]